MILRKELLCPGGSKKVSPDIFAQDRVVHPKRGKIGHL